MATQWPRSAFLCCSVSNDASDGDDAWAVTGVDVAAIAFVVKAQGRHALPRCGLHDVDEDIGAAFDLLLGAGNAPPATQLSGPDAFVAQLRKRDHRAAIAMMTPTLFLDRNGAPTRVEFRVLSARVGAGYTVARGDRGLEQRHNVGAPTDLHRYTVSFMGAGAVIEHWQRFAMGNPGDGAGRYNAEVPAPLGWIRFTYHLRADGTSEAHAAASYLPSCWFYRDWLRVCRRDMLQASREQIERVVLPEHEVPSGTTWAMIDTSTGQVHGAMR